MEEDSLLDQEAYRSYGPRNANFERLGGSGWLKPLKNQNDDIRAKITHVESLGLGILGTTQSVNYGTWKNEPACLVCLRFNHRSSLGSTAFRNVEILVSCEPWRSRSSDLPVLRNFSPRQSRVRQDDEHGTWGWESMQRCWATTNSDTDPSQAAAKNKTQVVARLSGQPWSDKRRSAAHQILWSLDDQSEGRWDIPDELNFAFVVQYISTFQASVEVKAKTRIGLPFPLMAIPWSRDDPLLFNGKTQIGTLSVSNEFDRFSEADWAKVAPYVPDWGEEASKKSNLPTRSTQTPLNSKHETRSEATYRVRGLPDGCDYVETRRLIALTLLIDESSVKVESLAESPYRRESIATVTFREPPGMLVDGAAEGKNEWQFETENFSGAPTEVRKETFGKLSLIIDTHFYGFTPYRNAQSPDAAYDVE